MNDYLEHLAKKNGLHTSTSGSDYAGGWEDLYAEKDGRPLPTLAVHWYSDLNLWGGMLGVRHGDPQANFAHPHDAFAWLKEKVDACEWPVCPKCCDTGIVQVSVDRFENGYHWTDDTTEPCTCWFGERLADKEG